MGVRKEEEGWSTTRKAERSECSAERGSERGKQKKGGKMGGARKSRRGSLWMGFWSGRERRTEGRGAGKRKRPNGHRKSGAFSFPCQVIRLWCVFTPPRDVATKRTLQITATNNKQLFLTWTRTGDEDKSLSVSAAHVLQNTPFSKLQHQSDFHIMKFFIFI